MIEAMVTEEIDRAIRLGVVKTPAMFKRKFETRTCRSGSTAYGGLLNGKNIPFIRMPKWWIESALDEVSETYKEYARIAKDPEIGNYACTKPGDYERLLLQHELAHAIVWWNWHRSGRPTDDRPIGHSGIWRRCYRQLRRDAGLTTG